MYNFKNVLTVYTIYRSINFFFVSCMMNNFCKLKDWKFNESFFIRGLTVTIFVYSYFGKIGYINKK